MGAEFVEVPEIGDASAFKSSALLVGYAGLAPVTHRSPF